MAVYTYGLLAMPFLVVVLLLDLLVLKTRVIVTIDFWIVLGIMLGFTLVFDQFFTGLPIVNYDFDQTLGIRLWYAPIEDFTYTIAACIGIGALLKHVSHESA